MCGARCCRHVALHIDTPRGKEDYDHLRWYLKHHNVTVFIDHDDDWLLEFSSPCAALGPDNACRDYDTRPRICRRYPGKGVLCEFESDDPPWKVMFENDAQLERWLDASGIDWRFRRP